MKNIIAFFLMVLVTASVFAQSTTITPGSVLPQMTTAQRTALANPVNGMMVYDTNTNSYWFYQQNAWVELPKGGDTSNYWQLEGLGGNEIKNTNSGGFWSGGSSVSFSSNPPTAPTQGNGTRLMWIPTRSAFRVGTVAFNSKAWDADSIGALSFATGLNSKALGELSVAMGRDTKAIGQNTLALGYGTKASGSYATGIGYETNAQGSFSIAMGSTTTASGNTATAFGYYTSASGDFSTTFGSSTNAQGILSTAMGTYTSALGYASTAFGTGTIASGDNSATFGYYSTSKASDGITIGTYNDDTDDPDPSTRSSTDRLFQIGNGTYNILIGANKKNAMTVLRNANTGINTAYPEAMLHVNGYTKLGNDAPKIKVKKLTGTTNATQGNRAFLPHLLDSGKILSVEVLVEYETTDHRYVPASYLVEPDYEFSFYISEEYVVVWTKAGNSADILSKPIKVLITYEE